MGIDRQQKRSAIQRVAMKLATYCRLGLGNVARVSSYRFQLRLGIHRVIRAQASSPRGDFFSHLPHRVSEENLHGETGNLHGVHHCQEWTSEGLLFGYHRFRLESDAPDWMCNRLTGQKFEGATNPWWRLHDFDSRVGDIKGVWELSRMDWVLAFSQHAALGEASQLTRLNDWLSDWCQSNPAYLGPNWKCGQEASIRVIHLLIAAHFLGQLVKPSLALTDFIAMHLQRISPTLSYAVGQSNNHATSEAAALFIGGEWLASQGHADGNRWSKTGRLCLENRARRLISPDGTFSQYSVNYHRLMLDAFSVSAWWQRHRNLAPFSDQLHLQLSSATDWLHVLVDDETGEAANIGANDGANLLPLTRAAYRDFRPSVCLAMCLFRNCHAYPDDPNSQGTLRWFGLVPNRTAPKQTETPIADSRIANDGGFAVLKSEEMKVVLRYPRFRFRPSQADALHLDLWVGSANVLRDAGSYSYNTDQATLDYFNGPAGHNTVQFDSHDQMPRISRFLFGSWLKTRVFKSPELTAQRQQLSASYRDSWGASHQRTVVVENGLVNVTDSVGGFADQAVLRWRMIPGDYQLTIDGQAISVVGGKHKLTVTVSVPLERAELVQGWESLFYGQKSHLPVLEVQISKPGRFVTTYEHLT